MARVPRKSSEPRPATRKVPNSKAVIEAVKSTPPEAVKVRKAKTPRTAALVLPAEIPAMGAKPLAVPFPEPVIEQPPVESADIDFAPEAVQQAAEEEVSAVELEPVATSDVVSEAEAALDEPPPASEIAAEPAEMVTESFDAVPDIGSNSTELTRLPEPSLTPTSIYVPDDASSQMFLSFTRAEHFIEKASTLTKLNVEAMVASSRIAASAFEEIGEDVAAFSRKRVEEASEAWKVLAEAKTPEALFEAQGNYARGLFEDTIAQHSKIVAAMIDLANRASQPVASRYAAAFEIA